MRAEELQRKITRCRACAGLLRKQYVDPTSKRERLRARPVVARIARAPVMLVGQAPGLDEYSSGRPSQGGAGKEIRRTFERQGFPSQMFDRVSTSSQDFQIPQIAATLAATLDTDCGLTPRRPVVDKGAADSDGRPCLEDRT